MLLPLDEVPVHVPLRRPRPLRFERLRVPVWNPYSRDLNLIEEFKFKLHRRDNLLRLAPQLAATPWGGSPPRPLCQKICYSDCTENCPLRPLRAPRRFRNPKIRQQLGAQPTPRFRGMIEALIEALVEALIDPLHALHFLLPTGDSRSGRRSFDSKLISLLPLDDVPVHVHRFAARVPCDSKGSGRPGVSVESIQPRPPRPCEVARPKGGEGKTDANLTHFF